MKKMFVLIMMFVLSTDFGVKLASASELWVARYNGPGNNDDYAEAIAIDDFGNVYVTGESYDSVTGEDYATIKYNSSGNILWIRRYNGPGNGGDGANAIAVDNSGNVYVTGQSWDSVTWHDYATIKYNSSGDTVWVRRYNGPGDWNDYAKAIVVDNSGNVYITGASYGSGTNYDYATVKYNSLDDTLWVVRYNGPGNLSDRAYAIAVDDSGNVYVTGYNQGEGTTTDYATIKYNSSGVEQWVRRYNGPANSSDYARAIAVDDSGNVYVTGSSYGLNLCDYATIKYNSSGDSLWVRRYDGPDNYEDYANAIAVDDNGNVYVTGYSYASGSCDYTTIKYNSSGDSVWVRRYNGVDNSVDCARAITIDGSGNVYVTGESFDSIIDCDYATVKYNSSGIKQWVAIYDRPDNYPDYATAIAVDSVGNVYVTGRSFGLDTYYDYATIKYSCAGIEERDKRLETGDWRLEVCPNPAGWSAIIKYQIPAKSRVSLKIYDITGRIVKTLVSEEKKAGYYDVSFDTQRLTTGIYFAKLKVGDYQETKKLILIR